MTPFERELLEAATVAHWARKRLLSHVARSEASEGRRRVGGEWHELRPPSSLLELIAQHSNTKQEAA